jgi:hypothetical protein
VKRAMAANKVAAARARTRSGFDEKPLVFGGIVEDCAVEGMIAEMRGCRAGDGDAYRDIVCRLLAYALDYVVDLPLVATEVPISSGRCDVELPLKTEEFGAYYQWGCWHRDYNLHSLIVEVKNTCHPAPVEAVRQLSSYLTDGHLGCMGILVSRRGFSENAQDLICSLTRSGRCLILPLDEPTLAELLMARRRGPEETVTYLRRAETMQFRGRPVCAPVRPAHAGSRGAVPELVALTAQEAMEGRRPR